MLDIVRIAVDEVVTVGLNAEPLKPLTISIGRTLPVVAGDDHRANHEPPVCKLIAKAEHILIISDAKIRANFVLLDVFSTDDKHNLNAVAELLEHAELAVGLEAWQDTRGVIIIKKLASKLKVKLAIKLGNTLSNML